MAKGNKYFSLLLELQWCYIYIHMHANHIDILIKYKEIR